MPPTRRRRPWEAKFLEALEKTGIISRAVNVAKISRATYYNHLDADPEFAAKVQQALDRAADLLESEIRRRAVTGWDEPVWHKGEIVGYVRKKSDALLIYAHRNVQNWHERKRKADKDGGKEAAPAPTADRIDFSKLSPAALEAAQAMLDQLREAESV